MLSWLFHLSPMQAGISAHVCSSLDTRCKRTLRRGDMGNAKGGGINCHPAKEIPVGSSMWSSRRLYTNLCRFAPEFELFVLGLIIYEARDHEMLSCMPLWGGMENQSLGIYPISPLRLNVSSSSLKWHIRAGTGTVILWDSANQQIEDVVDPMSFVTTRP